eukprot:COSAG05_NODE_2309_length_3245_cov_2.315003_5_plen_120_part_00
MSARAAAAEPEQLPQPARQRTERATQAPANDCARAQPTENSTYTAVVPDHCRSHCRRTASLQETKDPPSRLNLCSPPSAQARSAARTNNHADTLARCARSLTKIKEHLVVITTAEHVAS